MREWNVTVRKDGRAVRVYHQGKLQEEMTPGKDTYGVPAGAVKFAEELYAELNRQSGVKKADHDVQTEPNLKNNATGSAVTGKPSPTTSSEEAKVAKLQGELRKTKAQLTKERRRHALEVKARRGAKLAEILVKRGAIEEKEDVVTAFVKDVAMMSDDEIGRLERKAAGESEFVSVEEAERAERAYKREARSLLKKADESHESGDEATADRFDEFATDALKNAECCRTFIRTAAHVSAAETGTCDDCGKPKFVCKGDCNGADDKGTDADDKGASTDATGDKEAASEDMKKEAAKCDGCDCTVPCKCKDCKCSACKGKSASAEPEVSEDDVDKTADHDVQTEPNLKNDSKGVAVTGKPSPSTNAKADDESIKKEAAKCDDCKCEPCECDNKQASLLKKQHVATAKMYRKMAGEAEERGDFITADTYDHKAEVCEDLAKDAAVETTNPEPELAGVTDERVSDMEHEASEEASSKDTNGPSEGAAKTASADDGEVELTDELIEAAVTPQEVHALRSAYRGQRRQEPSRVDPSASGVMRIANVDENAASNDEDVSALESLWTGVVRD